jgi:hypothetical protein
VWPARTTGTSGFTGAIFTILFEAQVLIENWRNYNRVRPHRALGCRPLPSGAIRPGCHSTDPTLESGKRIVGRFLSSKTPELPRCGRAGALEAKSTFVKIKKAPSKGLRSRGDSSWLGGRAIRGMFRNF